MIKCTYNSRFQAKQFFILHVLRTLLRIITILKMIFCTLKKMITWTIHVFHFFTCAYDKNENCEPKITFFAHKKWSHGQFIISHACKTILRIAIPKMTFCILRKNEHMDNSRFYIFTIIEDCEPKNTFCAHKNDHMDNSLFSHT